MDSISSFGDLARAARQPCPGNCFAQAVLSGLSQAHKTIPARYLYDERGSELFEAITALPEYYLARAEIEILGCRSAEIARLTSSGRVVVEFGSGSATKTPLLLDQVGAAAYVPVDISDSFLDESASRIARKYPELDILPIGGDFTQPIALPPQAKGKPALGFFPGSTIGNFVPAAAAALLREFAGTLGTDAFLVIGIDRRKDAGTLASAYNDAAGVTAAFNLNLIDRMKRELDSDIRSESFRHLAVWNERLGRVEMHLKATRDTTFTVGGRRFRMRKGETIHTENSYKYSLDEARLLARVSGWEPVAEWTDTEASFSLHLWRAPPCRAQP